MRDIKLRIYGQFTINSISFFCFYLSSVLNDDISLWKLLIYIIVTTFIIWESLRLFILWARNLYPDIIQTRHRLLLVTFFTLLMVAVFPFIKFWIGDLIQLYGSNKNSEGHIRLYDYLRIMGQNIFYCLFITAVYETIYFFELWKQMFLKMEALKKEQVFSQLHLLKEQVSPHFLFNTLNTLSSLVSRDAAKAEHFIEEMATVYRYLLDTNDRRLVTLREELDFVNSYTHLLKTRYNNYFNVSIDIDNEHKLLLLPPLTLQLLVENAVKHNVVDSTHPLHLTIQSKDDQNIIVQNPIHKRRQPVHSEKKGLLNIIARYELLNYPTVVIEESETFFTVTLPLIQKPVYEGVDY